MRRFLSILIVFLLLVSCLAQQRDTSIDWESASSSTIDLLANLVRIRTINAPPEEKEISEKIKEIFEASKSIKDEKELATYVKAQLDKIEMLKTQVGNELELVNYVKDFLDKEGIKAEVVETAPSRGCLLARLEGDRSKKPFIIMAHVDVVNVERGKWIEADPFKGEIKNNYLYGRGVIDDKGMAACAIMSLVLLKRCNIKISRDIILLLTADEEAGGYYGIKKIVEKHFDKIKDAEFALNEGGEILIKDSKKVVFVQVAEKSMYNLKLKAKGVSGHSSVPHSKNAIDILSKAIYKLSQYKSKVKITPITSKLFSTLAQIEEDEKMKQILLELASNDQVKIDRSAELLTAINSTEAFFYNALIRNTATTTITKAGIRFNVIPSEAHATVNVRLLPEKDIDSFIKELRDFIGLAEVELESEISKEKREKQPPVSSIDSEPLNAISKVVSQIWADNAFVTPYMSTGATDSRDLRIAGIPCYGILPMPLLKEDLERMHGNDERVSLESMREGIEFMYRLILELAQ